MALTTQQRLDEARSAYHELMTGQAVSRFIDQNGESVQYTRANSTQLAAYIQKLEAELANGNAIPYRGPIRFTYGRRC